MVRHFSFTGGKTSGHPVRMMKTVAGPALADVDYVNISEGSDPGGSSWTLRGVISNIRYATASEVTDLRGVQAGLGRPTARWASLIPIRKTQAWWDLAQDARRAIFEETSHHTAIGMAYLPAIARQLYHSRDLAEPFDFLTWFEYAPEDEPAFEALLAQLRASKEWAYVDREIEIRLSLA